MVLALLGFERPCRLPARAECRAALGLPGFSGFRGFGFSPRVVGARRRAARKLEIDARDLLHVVGEVLRGAKHVAQLALPHQHARTGSVRDESKAVDRPSHEHGRENTFNPFHFPLTPIVRDWCRAKANHRWTIGSTEKSSRYQTPSLPFVMKPFQSSVRKPACTFSPSTVFGSPPVGVAVHDHVPAFGPVTCRTISMRHHSPVGTSATTRPFART